MDVKIESSYETKNSNDSNITENFSHQINRWPHLESMFIFVKQESNILVYRCRLCLDQKSDKPDIRCGISSYSNLKDHLKRLHSQNVAEFENLIEANKKLKRFMSKKQCKNDDVRQMQITSLNLKPCETVSTSINELSTEFEQDLLEMLSAANLSLSFVDIPEVRTFFARYCTLVNFPEKAKLKEILSEKIYRTENLIAKKLKDAEELTASRNSWLKLSDA